MSIPNRQRVVGFEDVRYEKADGIAKFWFLCRQYSATLLYYMTEEGQEGKQAFLEKRKPNFGKFKRLP
jgi:hypothetical protein